MVIADENTDPEYFGKRANEALALEEEEMEREARKTVHLQSVQYIGRVHQQ